MEAQNTKYLFCKFVGQFLSWYIRPNQEDQINKKPDDQIYDRTIQEFKKYVYSWLC